MKEGTNTLATYLYRQQPLDDREEWQTHSTARSSIVDTLSVPCSARPTRRLASAMSPPFAHHCPESRNHL